MTTYHQAGARTSGSNSLSGFPGPASVLSRGSDQHPQYPWNSGANAAISRVHDPPQPPPPLPKAQGHTSRPNLLVYIPPPPPPPPSNYKDQGAKRSHADSSLATKSTQQSGLSSSLKRSHSDISSSARESRAQQPKDGDKLPSCEKAETVTKRRRSDAPSLALESKAQPSRKSTSTKKLKWEPPPTKNPPPPSDLDASIDAINSLAGLHGRWQAANKVKMQSKRTRSRTRSKRQRSKGQQSSEVEILSPNEVAEESKSSEVWIDVDHGEVANPQSMKEVIDLSDDKVFPPLDVRRPTKNADILSTSVSSGNLEDMTTSQLSSYASVLENALDHTAHANSSGEEMDISSDEDEAEEDSRRAAREGDPLDTLYTDLQTPPRLSHLRSQADEGSHSDSQGGNTQSDNADVIEAVGESGDANATKNLDDRSDIDVAVPVADEPVEDDAVSNERKKHALRIAGRCRK